MLGHCTCWLDRGLWIIVLLCYNEIYSYPCLFLIGLLKYVSTCIVGMFDWARLDVVVLWWACLWLNKCEIFICMVLLNRHEGFKWKMHTCWSVLLLACLISICAYGLILSTSGVLPLSLPFPNILGSDRWSIIRDDLNKTWIFCTIQVGRSSVSEGDDNISLMELLCFSKTFMFTLFSFDNYLYIPKCGFFTLM